MNQRFFNLLKPAFVWMLTVAGMMAILWAAFWLVPATPARAGDTDEPGFKPIFNGQNLDGWDGDPRFWSVHDGAMVGETTAENPAPTNTFCIWRQGSVDNFELRCSFRTTSKWANSGIQFRSREMPELGKWVVGGYQADIEYPKMTGNLYDERLRGMLAPRGHRTTIEKDGHIVEGPPVGDSDELLKFIRDKEWNDYDVLAQGDHLVTTINGHVMADVTDKQLDKRAMIGILAMQIHEGQPMHVEFKNIRLKRLHLKTDRKKVVMVAGKPSHGAGEHEFRAGTILLKKCLDENAPQVLAVPYFNGWPADPTAFDNADAIMLYMDGGSNHPAIQRTRLAEIDRLMKRGVGLLCAHFAVEVPKDNGGQEFLRWIGGYYEHYWSVNPVWDLSQPQLAKDHPITRGVKPFDIRDEWYFHMRFPENMEGITPILSAIPPDKVHDGPDGESSGNKYVRERKGVIEALSWAMERPDGGRGYGFTGGHYHRNWGNDDYRKLMLNAILWAAKADVPPDGVNSTVTPEELKANWDKKP